MTLKKLIFLLFLLPPILQSATISPSGLDLSNSRSATLQIRNDSDSDEIYSAELLKVVQTQEGYTKLEESEDLTIFPPIIRLKSNKSRRLKVFKTTIEPIYGRYFIKVGSIAAPQIPKNKDTKATSVAITITTAKYIRIDINENGYTVDKNSIDFESIEFFDDKIIMTIQNTSNNFLRIQSPSFLLSSDSSDITKKFSLKTTIEILPKHTINYYFMFTKDMPKIQFEQGLAHTLVNYKIKNIDFVDDSVNIKY